MSKSNSNHICFIGSSIYGYLKPGEQQLAGGGERQMYLLGKELKSRGYDVSFIVGSYDNEGTIETIDGMTVYKILPSSGGVTAGLQKVVNLPKVIRKIDADIYYTRVSKLNIILTGVASSIFNIDHVHTVAAEDYVTLEQSGILNRLYLWSLKNASVVITQKSHQKDVLQQKHSIESTVLSNGYIVPSESALRDTKDREFVLWVGTIKKVKGPDRILQIAESLPKIPFILVGRYGSDSEYNKQIRRKIDNLDNVSHVGYVQPDKIDEYYRDAALLTSTSKKEGFPNVFLEAWRYGTPVITYNPILGGEITEKRIGRCSQSIEQMTRDVTELWNSPDERAELGMNSYQYMTENLSMEQIADEFVELVFSEIE